MRFFLAVLKSLRPWQWSKNILLFAALFFSGNLFDLDCFVKSAAGFALFCVISGAVYLLNDIMDIENDRLHPLKAKRPIAAGIISIKFALILFTLLTTLVFVISIILNKYFFILTAAYFLLLCSYSLGLKKVVIIDILVIGAGFLLRVTAGAVIIDVNISTWILLCTFFLALFLALNKRRHELTFLGKKAMKHRPVLASYSPYLLDQMIAVVTSSTVISYALYTRSEETVRKFGTTDLIYSVPFVVYGIFRYLYLVHKEKEGGTPGITLVKDFPILINNFLWALAAGIAIYT